MERLNSLLGMPSCSPPLTAVFWPPSAPMQLHALHGAVLSPLLHYSPQRVPSSFHGSSPCSFMRFMERYAEDKGLGFQKSG
jgi:hypothetical protein